MFLLCCNKIDGFLKETAFSFYRYNIYVSSVGNLISNLNYDKCRIVYILQIDKLWQNKGLLLRRTVTTRWQLNRTNSSGSLRSTLNNTRRTRT